MKLIGKILLLAIVTTSCTFFENLPFYRYRFDQVFYTKVRVDNQTKLFFIPIDNSYSGFQIEDKSTLKKIFKLKLDGRSYKNEKPFYKVLAVKGDDILASAVVNKELSLQFNSSSPYNIKENDCLNFEEATQILQYTIMPIKRDDAIRARKIFWENEIFVYQNTPRNYFDWSCYKGFTTFLMEDYDFVSERRVTNLNTYILREGFYLDQLGDTEKTDSTYTYVVFSDTPIDIPLPNSRVLKNYQEFDDFRMTIIGHSKETIVELMEMNNIEFELTTANKK